jgi:hypothetical protein
MIVMTQNRRDFIKSSTAVTLLTVSNASAEPAAQAVNRKIGVFHTTKISDQEWGCFKAGLGSSWQPTKEGEAGGQYGGTHKHAVLASYIHKENVDVIVAAGGVTSRLAASEELAAIQVPFVYMAGMAPDPPDTASSTTNGKYCGVILNVSRQYDTALTNNFFSMGIDKTDVLLIQNYNADMTPSELALWGYNYPSFRFFEASVPIDNPNPNNNTAVQNGFNQEWARFQRLYQKPKGVIVNPDPYFRLTAQAFKNALQIALPNIPVCYPFSDYGPFTLPEFLLPGAPILSSSSTTDTNNAYYVLGARTADVLNGLSSGVPIPPNKIDSMIWNGSGWTGA